MDNSKIKSIIEDIDPEKLKQQVYKKKVLIESKKLYKKLS